MVNSIYLEGLLGNVEIALMLFFFVWLFNWAKGSLGSDKLAVFFAIIVSTFSGTPSLRPPGRYPGATA